MATASKSTTKPAVPPKAAKVVTPSPAKPVTRAAAKPATKAAVKPAAKKAEGTKKSAPSGRPALAPDQRRFYIEVAAYYIAERRGFEGSSELEDWVQAEAEIDRLLDDGILNP